MISMHVQIKNLDTLRGNFRKAPATALYWLSRATRAAIFEVEEQAIESNFRFRTPRSMRTGMLSLSFAQGRQFDRSGLRGAIGPTIHYAPYVYWGTWRSAPNPFMDRIAKAAELYVEKHFNDAVDRIADDLARV